MHEPVLFNKSIKGASHITTGKPCQDYSGTYQDESVKIAVVCDGHGGSTYFRSDIGAKFATEITIQLLINFARCVDPSTFKGLSFAITAQPKRNPFIDADGNKMRFDELNEDQKKLALQAQSFIESEGKYPQQQEIVKDLLSQIYAEWISAIEKDARENPFSRKEKIVLNGLGIEKAYGCTLLAFLQTKEYWLSFHIGDGRISICDLSLNWICPVPEDCTCFLNYTTSLCDSNPLMEFRYAFCGDAISPLAVMLCSDGLEGSLRIDENLQDFYEQIINLCLDGDDIEEELESYLPSLSESGNKDDVSIAGIITISDNNITNIRKMVELKKLNRNIRSEYRNRKSEIDSAYNRIDVLTMKFERLKDSRFNKQTELDEMRQSIKSREQEVIDLDKTVNSLRKEIEELKADLKHKEDEFEKWKFLIKNEMAELESAQNEDFLNDNENYNNEYTNW
jgi:serine/threonine protein phosphatase PrpC